MKKNNHRHPHEMKPVKSISIPTNMLFVDTETRTETIRGKPDTTRQKLWFGFATHFRLEGRVRTRETKLRFEKASTFWDYLESKISPDRPLYVFAHNAAFDMTILDLWDTITERGYEVGYAVLESTPFIVQLNIDRSRVLIIDTYNYWKQSLEELGMSIGYAKLPMPDKGASKEDWDTYCYRDVEVLREVVLGLCNYLNDNELGSFSVSAASMAFSVYKTSFLHTGILLHDRHKALMLERSCYQGGLVNNFVVGKPKAKTIFHLDVNSLYPSCMTGPLPCKFVGDVSNIKPRDFLTKLGDNEACAWVLLESRKNTYPKRVGSRLCEVMGRVECYLCGIELRKAMECGDVKHIVYASIYETAPIFQSYVAYFWNERVKAKREGNAVNNIFAKLLMNSLYGRFAMRGRTYVSWLIDVLRDAYHEEGKEVPAAYLKKGWMPPNICNAGKWRPLGLSHSLSLRYVKGELEVELSTGEHTQSFVAVSAFITSLARHKLRSLIDIAGKDQVYYCDTDSLFCSEIAYARLKAAGEVDSEELGKLKLEGSAKHAVFYGPKDYEFGDKITLKGIKKRATKISENTYEQDQFEGIKSVLARGGAAYIDVKRLRKTLSRKYSKGTVGSSGRVTPFVLSDW